MLGGKRILRQIVSSGLISALLAFALGGCAGIGLGSPSTPNPALSETKLNAACHAVVASGDIGSWAQQQAACLGLVSGQKMCADVLSGHPLDLKLLPALQAQLAIAGTLAGVPPAVDPILNSLSTLAVQAGNQQAISWCESSGYSSALPAPAAAAKS